jgi:hypothetical protein
MPKIDPPDFFDPDKIGNETVVRIRHAEGFAVMRERDAKAAFWNAFTRVLPDDSRINADELDARVRVAFAPTLKSYLTSIAPALAVPESQRRAAAASAIVVRSRVRGYSSLELGLSFEPVNRLIELFDGKFEYFATFLGAYVPLAFQRSIQSPYWYSEGDAIFSQLSFDFEPSPAVVAAFSSIDSEHPSRLTRGMWDKARWTWILANTSLVVPTLVAAFYIYIILSRFHEREAAVDKGYHDLVHDQLEFIRVVRETQKPTGSSAPVQNLMPGPTATPAPSVTPSPPPVSR